MRQSLKIAISLLAALLLFAGFAVVSFSGLFNVLQTSFFLPGLEKSFADDLGALASGIDNYHQANLEAFAAQAKKDFVLASFNPALSQATIQAWADFKLQAGLSGVRLIGADGRRLLYSSFTDIDVTRQAQGRITYANYDADGTQIPAQELAVTAGGAAKVLIDGARSVFVYALPVTSGDQAATLAVYVPTKDLLVRLSLSQNAPVDRLTLVGRLGILINDPAGSPAVNDTLAALWSAGSPAAFAPLTLKAQDGTRVDYRVFTAKLTHGGLASVMVPAATFEMTDFMKGLLLGTFFFTVFLLVFLMLNLRTDPLEVLRQRVKRFQVELITELVETPGGADWSRWRREMEARKDEITWQIQRGIGRVSRKQKSVIDEYMSKSWAEIIDLISRRAEPPQGPPAAAIDVSRLEALIRSALQNANFVIPAGKVSSPRPPRVEEIGAEEVIEATPEAPGVSEAAGGAGGVVAEAEEAEEIEEIAAVEEAEAAEDVGSTASTAGVRAESAEEAEAVEEVEALEEVEAAEEAEAVEEAEAIEEAEVIEEVAAVEEVDSTPAAIEDELVLEEPVPAVEAAAMEAAATEKLLEEVEELPEAAVEEPLTAQAPQEDERLRPPPVDLAPATDGEVLELEPIEDEEIAAPGGAPAAIGRSERPVSDFMEIRIPPVGAEEGPSSGVATRASVETATIDDSLEELMPLMDITPLPPEPVEEGLELLPAEEEGGEPPRPTTGGPVSMLGDDAIDEGPADAEALEDGVPPEAEESGELEVLEAMDEEAEPEAGAAPSGASDMERRQELEALLSAGGLKVWTVEDLQRLIEENKSAIVMEDGVFRIKQDVYEGAEVPAKGRGLGLKELAEQVVRREREAPVVMPSIDELERGHPGSITELMPDDEPLDLAPSLDGEKESHIEETLSAESEKANPLQLKRNGVDYDAFLTSYPRSFTTTVQMKSLVEVSRRVSAVNAALLLKKVDGYGPDLTIGISEKSIGSFHFDVAEPFFSSVLVQRKAALVEKNPAAVRFLRERLDQDDLRYMKRAFFIPAVFRGQEAYLFLSFSSETETAIRTLLSKLGIQ